MVHFLPTRTEAVSAARSGWHQAIIHPARTWGTVGGVVAIAAVVAYVRHKRRPTPEEIERRRRMSLVERGRIGDGMIVDANLPDAPGTVMYLYHVGGVEYVCGQDLSALSVDMETVRVDQPVGVRYDPRNPYNSIITAETWTGLRLK